MPSSTSSSKERNWRSRKLWFSAFAVGVLYLGARNAADSDGFRAVYEAFVGGVVTITGLLLAGNVTAKWLGPKSAPETKSKKSAAPEESPE